MERRVVMSVAAVLVFGAASAAAQNGDLSNVTMRVLDDLRDVDAIVLELDANRGESEEGGESDGAERDAAPSDESRDLARAEAAEDDLRREREELHEDDDDRREGRREDRDVERPLAAPTTP